ncbi:hypothetical protein BKA66DRAFT_515056 [Pyrenochaeta sp. MPI-SDFR-AT-0127]|nr:hypothetical protein BKA66DRAFT_515056 [Pyrenochaeta sp. MPI-SDFR-AT-0127]
MLESIVIIENDALCDEEGHAKAEVELDVGTALVNNVRSPKMEDANSNEEDGNQIVTTDVKEPREIGMAILPSPVLEDLKTTKDISTETETNGDKSSYNELPEASRESVDESLPVVSGKNAEGDKGRAERIPTGVEAVGIAVIKKAMENYSAKDNATIAHKDGEPLESRETDTTEPATTVPNRIVPPHVRRDFQPTLFRQTGPQDLRHVTSLSESPRSHEPFRATRPKSRVYQAASHRGDADREQVARLTAQFMKAQNELNVERKKSVNLRKTIEAEQQQRIESAFSGMTSDLLCKQIEVYAQTAKNEARERGFEFREKKIKQLEVYLSEGQKQLKYKLEERALRPMDAVEREYIKRDAELSVRKSMADIEGKANADAKRLRFREAAQQMREQQYKALIHDTIESEIREKMVQREKLDEIAEFEYNRGFAAGKGAGHMEALEEGRQRGFLEGYGACHRTQAAISDMRAGRIPHDSLELDFLFDPSHSHNPYNIGARLRELEKEKKHDGHKGSNTEGRLRAVDDVVGKKLGEPVRKAPPQRPTFASELRGSSEMHNGHVVLANSSSSPTPASTPATISDHAPWKKPTSAKAPVYDDRVDEDCKTGRRLLRYKEGADQNLIDLLG